MNKEKIKELEEEISEAKRKIDELTAKLEEERNAVDITDRWKPALGVLYYTSNGTDNFVPIRWDDDDIDNHLFNSFDTWRTADRAKEVYEKIKALRMMEQIHDILCPDYKPNWNDTTERKWYCYYSSYRQEWNYDNYRSCNSWFVWFDTKEHAEQACKILNDMGIIPA